MADYVASIKVQLDDQASAGARAAADRFTAMADAADKANQSTTGLNETVARTGPSYDTVNRKIDENAKLLANLDTINRRYEASLAAVRAEADKTGMSTEELSQKETRLGQLRDQQAAAARRSSQALADQFKSTTGTQGEATESTNKLAFAQRNLSIQAVQAASGIATGQPIFQVLIQQGHQVLDSMLASGQGIAGVGRAIAGMINPVTLAIAGVTAFVGVIVAAAARSMELSQQLADLNVILQATGKFGDVTAESMAAYSKVLQSVGVSAGDAEKAMMELARTPAITAEQTKQVQAFAAELPTIAKVMGVDVVSAQKTLTEAAQGNWDAIKKLDSAFTVLSDTQYAHMRASVDDGKATKDVTTFMRDLHTEVDRLPNSLSAAAQGSVTLRTAWDQFLDRIGKTNLMTAAINLLTNAMRNSTTVELENRLRDLNTQLENAQKTSGGSVPAFGMNVPNWLVPNMGNMKEHGEGFLGFTNKPGDSGVAPIVKALQDQIAGVQKQLKDIADAKAKLDETFTENSALNKASQNGKKLLEDAAKDADKLVTNQIDKLKQANKAYTDYATTELGPRTKENAAAYKILDDAIAANNKQITDLNKKNQEHISTTTKQSDTLKAQIQAQNDLTDAYAQGDDAVQKVLATQAAQKQLISDGLEHDKNYNKLLADRTQQFLDLAIAQGKADYNKQLKATNDQIEAQQRVINAYDGTQASIDHATNAEKAYAEVLKDHIKPGTQEFIEMQDKLTQKYDQSTNAAKQFQQAQASVTALTDTLGNAFDRLGQSLVDAFTSGSGQAVNFGNIMKGILASIASDLIKLAIINPIRNAIGLGSGTLPTLSAAIGALGGNAGASTGQTVTDSSGNVLGTLSNAGTLVSGANTLTGGSLFQSLGLSDLGAKLGLTGSNGLFGNIGTGISSFLGSGIFGTSVAEAAAPSLAAAAFNPALIGQLPAAAGASGTFGATGAFGGASVGSALGGIGGGFALGSLAGTLLQGAMNKTGPAPMVGAGLGSLAGFAVGGPIGAIIGGIIGGAGGSLIGPHPASPYAVGTYLTTPEGQLSMGAVASQKMEAGPMVAQLAQDINSINAVLSGGNARITDTGGQFFVGSDPKHAAIQQTSAITASLADAFKNFRFGSSDVNINSLLSGRSFGDLNSLNTVLGTFRNFAASLTAAGKGDLITKFTNDMSKLAVADIPAQLDKINQFVVGTVPALLKLGQAPATTGTLPDAINALNTQFNAAIATAKELGYAEQDLTTARDAAIKMANDAAQKALDNTNKQLIARQHQAGVTLGTYDQQTYTLETFDAQAAQQRTEFINNLVSVYGDAYKVTTGYAEEMTQFDKTTAMERLAVQKQYNAQAQQAITQSLTGLRSYIQGLRVGDASPLSPQDQYSLAQSQFESMAKKAAGGDFNALSQLQNYSTAFLAASRTMFGSGSQYAADFGEVVDSLDKVASQSADALTASYFAAQVQAQTDSIVSALSDLKNEVTSVRMALVASGAMPPRLQ